MLFIMYSCWHHCESKLEHWPIHNNWCKGQNSKWPLFP